MVNYRRLIAYQKTVIIFCLTALAYLPLSQSARADSDFQANTALVPREKEQTPPSREAPGQRAPAPTPAGKPEKSTAHASSATADTPADNALSPADSDFESRPLLPPKGTPEKPHQKTTPKVDTLTSGPSLWRPLLSLMVVLALIVAGTYLFRRFQGANARAGIGGGIEVLARNGIGPKQSLCLVKFGERLLLIGLGPNYMTALDTVEDPSDVARIMGLLEKQTPHSITNTFSRLFQHEARQYDPQQTPSDQTDYQYENDPADPWYQAKGELNTLLDKVKGLTRIRPRR